MMDKWHGDEDICSEDCYCRCTHCEDEMYHIKQDLEYEAWADEIEAENSYE
jgi:hypothetical protein